MTDVSSNDSGCPECGSPLREVHTHLPGSVIREYRCGVRWLDVDDERKQAAFSGSPIPCNYARELRTELAEAQEQNRMLTARCDELAGLVREAVVNIRHVEMCPGHTADGNPETGEQWAVQCETCCRFGEFSDYLEARCSDEDCRAPLLDESCECWGPDNGHSSPCPMFAEQDEVTG